MGQTSSHKSHARSDFIKNANLNPNSYINNSGASGPNFGSSLDYNYQTEELIEDEEANCPTINSKSSYVSILCFILKRNYLDFF